MLALFIFFLIFSSYSDAADYFDNAIVFQNGLHYQPQPLLSINSPSSAPFYIQITARPYRNYIDDSFHDASSQDKQKEKKEILPLWQRTKRGLSKVADKISDGFDWITGEHKHHKHCHQQQSIKQERQQPVIQKPKEISAQQEQKQNKEETVHTNQYSQDCKEYEVRAFHTPIINDYYQRRREAIKSLANTYQTQQFVLPSNVIKTLEEHDIDANSYISCIGNQLQLALHEEFIAIIDHAADVKAIFADHYDLIVCNADIGSCFNKVGQTIKAMSIADWCWAAIDCFTTIGDCIIVAGQGAVEGVCNTAHAIIHPIQTAQNLARSISYLADCLARMALITGEIEIISALNLDESTQRIQNLSHCFDPVLLTIDKKIHELTLHDAIKETALCATELYLQGKILHNVGKFYSGAKEKALKLVQELKNPLPEAEVLLQSVEGIEVKVAADSIEYKGFQEAKQSIINIAKELHPSLEKNIESLNNLQRQIENVAKNVSKERVGKKFTMDTHVDKINKIEAEVEDFYNKMRMTMEDIEIISRNTGISKDFIEKIKKHIFLEEHTLYDGIRKFDPLPDMAVAWQRLIDNKFVYSDLLLLQHEYAESLIMNGTEVSYRIAHDIINKLYNWDASL